MLFRSVSQSRYVESAVPVGLNNSDATLIVKDSADPTKGVLFGGSSYGANDTLEKSNSVSYGNNILNCFNLSMDICMITKLGVLTLFTNLISSTELDFIKKNDLSKYFNSNL